MPGARKRPARLGEKLRAVRERFGLSNGEMAARLSDDEAAILKQDVFRYEKGETDPSLIILLRYSRLAEVRMEVFADDKLNLPW
jgi:predicted transcriptional regulator